MGKVVFVNKINLRIARENMGIDIYRASRQVSTSKKNYVSLWESGEELPTWVQIRKLANLYNISELLLLSKKKIKEDKEIPDFRVGLKVEEKEDVKKLINLILKRQGWLERILKGEGSKKNELLGSGKNINSPSKLAEYISDKLNISIEEIRAISGVDSRKKVLKYLIKKAENKNIFVGKTISYHKIPVKQMRGVFVSNDYCPFIVLNRKDAVSAQIFSFIHELAHFFRKSDSISNSIDFRDSNTDLNSEEVFCNKVAANLLLPTSDFKKDNYDEHDIETISNEYKLSSLFVFYRLKDLNRINGQDLNRLEVKLKKESEENIARQKKIKSEVKGGNYYNSMKDSNGNLFNKTIVNFYSENKISYTEASNLLKFSVENYEC